MRAETRVTVGAARLNSGDCFVLDAGREVLVILHVLLCARVRVLVCVWGEAFAWACNSYFLISEIQLFVWNGREANERERAKAISFAQRLSSDECGDAPVGVIGNFELNIHILI